MFTADTEKSNIWRVGNSLVTTIPAAIVKEYQLHFRDALFWTPGPEGLKLEIMYRRREPQQEAEVQEAAEAEAAE